MKRYLKGFVAIALALVLAGAASAQERPRVIAVNQALHDMAERLLGDDAEVVFPVPAGVDPSFWRPSISDISTIQSADLILLNGAGFATWVDRVSLPRARLVNTAAAIEDRFIVTESITHSHGDGGEHSHEGLASYTWLDPMLVIAQAEAIANAAIARNLASEDDVNARLADLSAALSAMDTAAQDALAGLEGTNLIATHPRYQYFARRYGLTITSLEWEAGAMPTEAELAELQTLASSQSATVLIWEAQPPEGAFARAEALGLQNIVFPPWASQAEDAGFIDAFTSAVSRLAAAASQGSN